MCDTFCWWATPHGWVTGLTGGWADGLLGGLVGGWVGGWGCGLVGGDIDPYRMIPNRSLLEGNCAEHAGLCLFGVLLRSLVCFFVGLSGLFGWLFGLFVWLAGWLRVCVFVGHLCAALHIAFIA